MRMRHLAWCLLVIGGLSAWWATVWRDRLVPISLPSTEEAVQTFGGGTPNDPGRDVALRTQLAGRWTEAADPRFYLDFATDGGLRGADRTPDPAASARGERTMFAVSEYSGRWEVHNGFVRLQKPNTATIHPGLMTVVWRARITEDRRLLLYDMPERIDQARVYRRSP